MKGKPGLKIEARRWWAGRRKTGAVDLSKPSVRFDGNKVSFHEVISFRWKKKKRKKRKVLHVRVMDAITHRLICSSIGSSLCSPRIGNSPLWICRSPIEWTRIPCWIRCPRPRADSRRVARTSEWRPRYARRPVRCSPIPEAWARCEVDNRGSSTRCGSISWKLASGKA